MAQHIKPTILVVGGSGHAKVVVDAIEREGRCLIGGVLDTARPVGTDILGYAVLGRPEDIAEIRARTRAEGLVVAIGDNWDRQQVVQALSRAAPDLPALTVVHPSAVVGRGVLLGAGTVILAGAVINTDARLGTCCIINTKASVDHDCDVGDFASVAPGATLGGRVSLGAGTAVGLGANIIQDRKIGSHTLIGAGALVVDDVPSRCVAYGVPARVVRDRSPGERYL